MSCTNSSPFVARRLHYLVRIAHQPTVAFQQRSRSQAKQHRRACAVSQMHQPSQKAKRYGVAAGDGAAGRLAAAEMSLEELGEALEELEEPPRFRLRWARPITAPPALRSPPASSPISDAAGSSRETLSGAWSCLARRPLLAVAAAALGAAACCFLVRRCRPAGLLVTAAALVAPPHTHTPSSGVRVEAGGRLLAAAVVASCPARGIALLRVDPAELAEELVAARWEERREDRRRGARVTVAARPLGGALALAASQVRGVARGHEAGLRHGARLLCVDGALPLGARGAPLAAPDGAVLGLCLPTPASTPDAPFTLAIDVEEVDRFVRAVAAGRQPPALPFLGVSVVPTGAGLAVTRVAPWTGAEGAGLRPGDLLLRVGHRPLRAPADLEREVFARAAGQRLLLLVRRGTRELLLPVPLDAAP
eukprot:tig00001094_g6999.t1